MDIGWTHAASSVLAAFLASLVECVEALTIVLAVGSVRGWRSALGGSGAALVVLLAIVAVLGPALARIPLHTIQIAVGALLLLFGLRWLRKSILRAVGVIPLHDEAAAFAKETARLRTIGGAGAWDMAAVAASFQITMLEGIEVVFIVIAIGAGGASLTGADCTPYTIHYAYDTTALGNGTASAIIKEGGKTWFFITADYAFGTQLQDAATKVVLANGGKVLGAVRAPLGTTDYSSFLLQAQASGAQVLGLANAGTDFSNSLKAANEFGITKTMKPAALLAFLTDIHAATLQTAQGLYLTTGFYWDLNDQTRAFGKRFFAKVNRMPTMDQAAVYSATIQYLNAVKTVGSTDSDKVMAQLKKTKINDFFAKDGYIREDGLMVHTMYVMKVKTPAESKYPWDYYKVVKVMTGAEADGAQPDPTCPMIKK